jgi:hypothetical protein
MKVERLFSLVFFFFVLEKLVKSKKGHWTLELRRDLRRPNTIIWYHCPGRFDSIVRSLWSLL